MAKNRSFRDSLWNHVGKVGTGRVEEAWSRSTGAPTGEKREVREWRYHWGRKEGCRKCKTDSLYSFSEPMLVNIPSLKGFLLFTLPIACIVMGLLGIFGVK